MINFIKNKLFGNKRPKTVFCSPQTIETLNCLEKVNPSKWFDDRLKNGNGLLTGLVCSYHHPDCDAKIFVCHMSGAASLEGGEEITFEEKELIYQTMKRMNIFSPEKKLKQVNYSN